MVIFIFYNAVNQRSEKYLSSYQVKIKTHKQQLRESGVHHTVVLHGFLQGLEYMWPIISINAYFLSNFLF